MERRGTLPFVAVSEGVIVVGVVAGGGEVGGVW